MKVLRTARRSGMTLIEVLVAMALMTILASAALALVSYSAKTVRRTETRSAHNRALNRLYTDLSERFFHTSYAYQSTIDNGAGLVLATARNAEQTFLTDTQGYPGWCAWEVIAVQGGQLCLWRVPSQPFAESARPRIVTGHPSRSLANKVKTFEASVKEDHTVDVTIDWLDEDQAVPTHWTFYAGQGGTL